MKTPYCQLSGVLPVFVALALVAVGCSGGGQTGAPAAAPEAAAPQSSSDHPTAQAPAPAAQPAPAPEHPVAQAPRPRAEAPKPAAQAPAPEPASPPPAPEPVAVAMTVPAGTELHIEFLDGVSSTTSVAGDVFRGRVVQDVVVDGTTVIPAGTMIEGSVTEAVSLKKIGGQAKLALTFSRLDLPDGEVASIAASYAQAGKSETGKDAGTIAGATAGGALLGRIIGKKDKGKATAIGAVVGAAAGTAIAAKTAGEEVELPAGTTVAVTLETPATINVRR